MKFVIFLIVSICAFKSFEARSILPIANDDLDISNEDISWRADISWPADIYEIQFNEEYGFEYVYTGTGRWEYPAFIKDLIEKIKIVLGNIKNGFSSIIQSMKDKMNDIIAKLPAMKDSLLKKIQELIKKGGAVGKKCVQKHQGEIDGLIKNMGDGLNVCVAQAQDKSKKIQDQVNVLVNKANAVKNGITTKATKCFNDNKWSPTGFINCLKTQINVVKGEIADVSKEIQKTISVAKDVAKEVGVAAAACAKGVQDSNVAKQQEILKIISKCIVDGGKKM